MRRTSVLARSWLVVAVVLCRVSGQDNQRSLWNKKADHVCLPGNVNMSSSWMEVTPRCEHAMPPPPRSMHLHMHAPCTS